MHQNGLSRKGMKLMEPGWNGNTLTSNPIQPGQHAGAQKQVEGHGYDIPVFRFFKKRSGNPGIECTHARATPNLIIHFSGFIPLLGPERRPAQIRAEYQRHFLFGIGVSFSGLILIPVHKKGAGVGPFLFQAASKIIPLQLNPNGLGNIFDAVISRINFIQPGRTLCKHGSTL